MYFSNQGHGRPSYLPPTETNLMTKTLTQHRRTAARAFLQGLAAFEMNVGNNPPVFHDPNAQAVDYEAAALVGMLIRDGNQLLDDRLLDVFVASEEAWLLATRIHPTDPYQLIRTAYVLGTRYEAIRMAIEHQAAETDDEGLDFIAQLNADPASFEAAAGPGGSSRVLGRFINAQLN